MLLTSTALHGVGTSRYCSKRRRNVRDPRCNPPPLPGWCYRGDRLSFSKTRSPPAGPACRLSDASWHTTGCGLPIPRGKITTGKGRGLREEERLLKYQPLNDMPPVPYRSLRDTRGLLAPPLSLLCYPCSPFNGHIAGNVIAHPAFIIFII
jgi:hypothetical protein